MAKRMRFVAACGVGILVFVLFFSASFMVAESEHDCAGEHCVICHQIETCQKFLEQFSTVHASSGRVVVLSFLVLLTVLRTQRIIDASSPVSLKVKLLN